MTALHCPSCGRSTVRGLCQTEQIILKNLVIAAEPKTIQQLMAGLQAGKGSPRVFIHRLRAALEPHGYRIETMPRKKTEHARYRLQHSEEK